MFSLYDVEQFLREAGAERINEKAVISLERELQDTVNELVDEASMYANYAGRKKLIKVGDIEFANKGKFAKRYSSYVGSKSKRPNNRNNHLRTHRMAAPKLMLVNNVPVIKADLQV